MDYASLGWNEGEDEMNRLLHVPDMYNPTQPGLGPHAQRLLHISSLFAIGIVDDQGRPWTNVLGGEPGFARSIGKSIIGVSALADLKYDPVLSVLLGKKADQEAQDGPARDFSALGIHLASRDRVKLQGKVVAIENANGDESSENDVGEFQAAFAITGSIGRTCFQQSECTESSRQLSKVSQ